MINYIFDSWIIQSAVIAVIVYGTIIIAEKIKRRGEGEK